MDDYESPRVQHLRRPRAADINIDIERFERIFKELFEARCDRVEAQVNEEAEAVMDGTDIFAESESFNQWLTNIFAEGNPEKAAVAITTFGLAFAIGRRYGFSEWAEASDAAEVVNTANRDGTLTRWVAIENCITLLAVVALFVLSHSWLSLLLLLNLGSVSRRKDRTDTGVSKDVDTGSPR